MNRKNVSRRQFLQASAVGVSAVAMATPRSARAVSANEKVQLGWIGVGGRATGLLNHMLANCPDARTTAVCDLRPERVDAAKKLAERDKPTGYIDFRQMMDKEKLDGILIATEPCNHAKVVVPVLEAGFNTFAEKPMDIDVETVDAITAAARKSKGLYQIGTQRRYHPTYIAAMEAIHAGLLGKVTFMQGGWHWSSNPSGAAVARDGGRLIEQASHHTDVMAWAMKDQHPLTCVAMGYAQENRPEGPNVYSETHSSTTFQFPGGALFSYTHLWCLPGKYDKEILTVFGEKGAVDLNQGMYFGRDEKEKKLGEASGKAWDMGTVEELVDFVANLKSGAKRKPNANVETGRVCSLMCIMGRMAMVNAKKNVYEPSLVKWEDLGTKTDLPER